MLNVNMMCPQNRCAPVVPVGIMPLLPAADSPSPSPTSGITRAKQIPNTVHHHHNHFDDDLASMSSITPPPSSPSDHSPNMAPMPMIATDEEGQLIFQFSAPDEEHELHEAHEATHSLAFASDLRNRRYEKEHGNNGLPCVVTLSQKLSTFAGKDDDMTVAPPFPVPPSQPTPSAACTLTPSFFTLPPSTSSSSLDASPSNDSPSPFPFAPPVPTTNGLHIQPASAMTMTLSDSYAEPQNKLQDDSSVHATNTPTTTSPTSSPLNHHHRSTSSSASTITPMSSKSSPTSPLSTPHASPTLLMRSSNNNASAATPSQHNLPPVAGPLAALQLQHHPRSPQLSGLPSPSLIPPSPLSLYPPSLDLNPNPSTNPTGFFPERKKGIANTAITGHVKRASGSALARPTSPVVKPLKS
jgi:hypothetical protein